MREEAKMASRGGGGTQLFVGRLSKETKLRDLENVFYLYGKLNRCDIKTGRDMAYGFIEYEDARDAEAAMTRENNRKLFGSRIVVEYVKSRERGRGPSRPVGDECFKCGKLGHWASSCTESRDSRDSRDVLTDSRPPYRPRRSSPPSRRPPPPPPRYRSRSRSPPPRRGYGGPPPRGGRRRSLSPPQRRRGPPPMSRGRYGRP